MRSLLLAFLVCLPSLVNAQSNNIPDGPFRFDYPIVCDDTQKVITVLEKEFEEQLSWRGSHASDNSKYSLWINEKEKSWTLLKMTTAITCILGVGTESVVTLGTLI